MTEMTGRSLSPVEAPRPAPEGDRVADFRAKVRAAGQEWTGSEPDELVELLTKAAAGDPRLAAIVDAAWEPAAGLPRRIPAENDRGCVA